MLIYICYPAQLLAEGTYELSNRSGANPIVWIESPGFGQNAQFNLNLARRTIFKVDVRNANEVIDFYTSRYEGTTNIAVWAPGRSPSSGSPDWTFNVSQNGQGHIKSWQEVVDAQNINSRPRTPATYTPSTTGTYTVILYGQNSGVNNNGIRFFDIMVRGTNGTGSTGDDDLRRGRLWSDHLALNTQSFDNGIFTDLYFVDGTDQGSSYEGYLWEGNLNGIEPYGFHMFANRKGAYPSQYHSRSINSGANPTPVMRPALPMYFNPPSKPIFEPIRPSLRNLVFNASCSGGTTNGGNFEFDSNGAFDYEIILDENGDGKYNRNTEKTISGRATGGHNVIPWDGKLADGSNAPDNAEFSVVVRARASEIHFPFYDVENNNGDTGPTFQLYGGDNETSKFYYWDDTPIGGNSVVEDGSLSPHTWGGSIGDQDIVDTWKTAYESVEEMVIKYNCSDANLDINKIVDESTPSVGQQINYTLSMLNRGPVAATGITVTDNLPSGITYISHSGGSYDPSTGNWDVPDLSVDARDTLRIVAQVNNGTEGTTITNTANIDSFDQSDPDQSNNSSSADIQPTERRADLNITITDSDDPVITGNLFTYSLQVTNSGPVEATGVTLTDNLPSEVTFQSVNTTQGSCSGGSTVNCNLGLLAQSDTAEVNVIVEATSIGTASNSASVNGNETDPDTGNNSSSETTEINSKSTFQCYPIADRGDGNNTGDRLDFIDTQNNTVQTIGFTGTQNIEANTYNSATGIMYAANGNRLGTINLNSGAFTARANTFGTAGGSSGEVTLSDVDGLAFDATTGILYGVHRRSGTELLFQIDMQTGRHVQNAFGSGVDYVEVTEPSGLETLDDIAIDPTDGQMYGIKNNSGGSNDRLIQINKSNGNGTDIGRVTVNGTGINDIEGLGVSGGNGQLIGVTGTNETIYTIDQSNAQATSISTLSGRDYEGVDCIYSSQSRSVDLGLNKTIDQSTPEEGDTISFTVTVSNNGPDQATTVQVADSLPSGLSFVSSNATQGSYDSGNSNWFIGTLNAGNTATLTITASVDQGTGGSVISNTASVNYLSQNDPNSDNDSSTADVNIKGTLRGTVFEDISGDILSDGDGILNDAGGDQRAMENVKVLLFRDGGDGIPDGSDDTFIGDTLSSSTGEYAFTAAPDSYWIVVDSRSGALSNGSTWAEQTYAGTGAYCNDGAGGTSTKTSSGSCFGGRRGNQSDGIPTSPNGTDLLDAEHLIGVTLNQPEHTDNDFGFSFNVLTQIRDGDDDGSAARSIQGSLRQFIQNANAISGANTMRFVPAVPTNQSSWWSITLSRTLPELTDGSTTIDGTAYILADGVTIRDINTGNIGTGGTVGVDNVSLNTFSPKELELDLNDNGNNTFQVNTSGPVTIREIAAYNNSNLLRINNTSGATIENSLWGTRADGSDPGGNLRGNNGINTGGSNTISLTIRNSYLAFLSGTGIGSGNPNISGQITGSEFYRTSLANSAADGIDVIGTWNIQENLFHENGNNGSQPERGGAGIEMGRPTGTSPNNVIRNNTTHQNAVSGINLLSNVTDNLIEKNVIYSNGTNYASAGTKLGAGIKLTIPDNNTMNGNTISKNSIYDNYGLGIDLVGTYDGGADSGKADGPTVNDTNDSDSGPNGLLNFPIIEDAQYRQGELRIQGFARPGTIIELFLTSEDASGFGEGKTYIATATEGSSDDLDAGSGSYSGQINGFNQGNDATQRFEFAINVGNKLNVGDKISATGTATNGSTSEFNGAVSITEFGSSISGMVYEDANHSGIKDSNENGISNVTIVLYSPGNSTCQSIQTGSDGSYEFQDIEPGDYKLIESATESTPNPGSCAPAENDAADYISTTKNTIDISVSTTPLTNNNFGDFKGSKLTGTVFEDNGTGGGSANDGVQNGGEAGIAKSILKLTGSSGNTVHTQTETAGDGSYTLWIPDALSGSSLKVIQNNINNNVSTGGSDGNTGGSYNRPEDSITFTPTSGDLYKEANFADVPNNGFNTDGQQNISAGTTAFFPHTFTARTAGEVTFSEAATANPSNWGWSQIIYRDNNCSGDLDNGEQSLSGPITVTAGDQVCIIVRANTPNGASEGSSNTITITADFTYTNASPSLSKSYKRTDLINITGASASGLKITKKVNQAQALPGETLTYTITYTNNSSTPISNLEITDDTPNYTHFTSASCNTPLPESLTACTISNPGAGNTGTIIWSFSGQLASGSSSTVTYQVTIKN